jgi:CheY-like chemotaxis protein
MAKAHVLIIDDNETGIKVLSQMLSMLDVSSIGVQDPTQLSTLVDDINTIDAIFLDLEMPKIGGYEMLGILREHFKATVPIIAHSVHTSEIHKAMELGFDGFLGKPLHMRTFPGYMTRILKGERVWEID